MFIRSFREWLRNPRLFRQQAREYERQLADFAAPADPQAIEAMVEQLLLQDPGPLAHERIRAQGGRAVPALVSALQDPRFRKQKLGTGLSAVWPVERVLGILRFVNAPEAVGPAAALLGHEDGAIRQAAAMLLGSIGNDACAEPVTRALQDVDDRVRTWAAMGIQDGMKENRSTPGFLNAVFEPLAAQLDRPRHGCYIYAPDCLLEIDRPRAMSVILSDRVLRADNDQLHQVLRAVRSAGETIPGDKLLPLLDSIRPLIDQDPRDAAYGEALVVLARGSHPDREQIIRDALRSENARIRFGAADAIATLKGALPPHEFLTKRRQSSEDYEDLTPPQQICYCVDDLQREVCNGGFAQYFFNTSGDHARDALAALRAVNAHQTESMLRRAIGCFGPRGSATEREARQDQLAAFSDEQNETLHELDSQFFEDPDELDLLLSLYAAEHAEHFKSSGAKGAITDSGGERGP